MKPKNRKGDLPPHDERCAIERSKWLGVFALCDVWSYSRTEYYYRRLGLMLHGVIVFAAIPTNSEEYEELMFLKDLVETLRKESEHANS